MQNNWFNSAKWHEGKIQAGAIKTSRLDIICGVPEESILGSLLFIICVNDLCNVSIVFEPKIYADDRNFFFSHKKIKELFHTANL